MALKESATFRKMICQLLSKFDVQLTIHNVDVIRAKAAALLNVSRDDAICRKALEKFLATIEVYEEAREATEVQLGQVDDAADGVARIELDAC